MAGINFFNEDILFTLPKPGKTRTWIREVIRREKGQFTQLNFIFCSDSHLLTINQQYLNHKTLTDIITFDNSEGTGMIEGDIFVSVERISANARVFKTSLDEETHRVLVHGVLHLLGYSDKSRQQKSLMRKKEDAYLSLRDDL